MYCHQIIGTPDPSQVIESFPNNWEDSITQLEESWNHCSYKTIPVENWNVQPKPIAWSLRATKDENQSWQREVWIETEWRLAEERQEGFLKDAARHLEVWFF